MASSVVECDPNAGVGTTAASSICASSPISSNWSDMSYDLLVLILARLSSVDLIVGVSAVCSSWRAAARDPHCWRIVDLSDRCSVACRFTVPVRFSQLFKRALALARDHERIEKVFLPPMANGQDLILVSHRLPNLLYLSFPNHKLNEKKICTAMANFKSLKGIEAVENFFHLTIGAVSHLKTVVAVKILGEIKIWRKREDWREALVALLMCKLFPNLKKLEMSDLSLNTLQNFHDKVDHHDISTMMKVFEKFESLYS